MARTELVADVAVFTGFSKRFQIRSAQLRHGPEKSSVRIGGFARNPKIRTPVGVRGVH